MMMINWTHGKWRPASSDRCCNGDLALWHPPYVSFKIYLEDKGSHHTAKAEVVLVSRGQYTEFRRSLFPRRIFRLQNNRLFGCRAYNLLNLTVVMTINVLSPEGISWRNPLSPEGICCLLKESAVSFIHRLKKSDDLSEMPPVRHRQGRQQRPGKSVPSG